MSSARRRPGGTRAMLVLGLWLALLSMPAAATPAAAIPSDPPPAATVTRLALDSVGGAAAWSTCAVYPPAPGTECIETFIIAEDIKRQHGTKLDEVVVLLDQRHVRYEADEPVLLRAITGSASVPSKDAAFRLGPRLRSLDVQVDLFTSDCTFAGDQVDCVDGVAELTASWSATREPVRFVDNATPGHEVRSPSFSVFHVRSTSRTAEATADVDGVVVPGGIIDAFLVKGGRASIFVCAGGPHADPAECALP